MNKLFILSLLILSGCTYQTINAYDLDEANEFCKDKGGIAEIIAAFTGLEKVTCKNNEGTYLHEGKSK